MLETLEIHVLLLGVKVLRTLMYTPFFALISFYFILLMCVNMYTYVHVCMYFVVYIAVRGQLVGVDSLLLPWGSWESNLHCQVCCMVVGIKPVWSGLLCGAFTH